MLRKFAYWLLQPHFEQLRADIDYLLMMEGEK